MQVNRCFGCMEEITNDPCPYCGYPHGQQTVQGYVLQPGTILHGKYLIGKVLGQGGFGLTYIGWDLVLNRKVAIKEFFPASYVTRDTSISMALQWYRTEQAQTARSTGQEMFLKEARKMCHVASFPQVVHVLDLFRDNNTAYIIMNYIHGRHLAQQVKSDGPMPWQDVVQLLLPAIDVMQQVHDAGLIHRDLSPDNLMIQPDNSITILDLGAAKDLNLNSGDSSMQVAKGGFSPLELYVMRGSSGPWTDVYSMAATMYYAITGITPPAAVERMDKDVLRWDLPQLRKMPPAVIHVLQKGMALQLKERYQSMADFAAALRKAASPRRRWKLPVLAAAAAILLIVLCHSLQPIDRATGALPAPPEAELMEAEQETRETDEPQPVKESWTDNVLTSSLIPQSYQYDTDAAPVFGSHIARYQILSVTFVDSLRDMGDDSWDVSQNRDGSVMAWVTPNGTVTEWENGVGTERFAYDLYIGAEAGINGKSCAFLFEGYQNLEKIDFGGCFHTDYAESMENMFGSCYALKKLDISKLNTSRVRNMTGMFANSALEELNLHNLDTSAAENMSHMFSGCDDLKTLDLSRFNTTNVTTMDFMFYGMNLVELDLSGFDTSSLTSMGHMFSKNNSLEVVDTGSFNTSKVKNMEGVFQDCTSLTTVVGLEEWDTSSVEQYDNFLDEGLTVSGIPWIELFE